jgi:hypothetical protein
MIRLIEVKVTVGMTGMLSQKDGRARENKPPSDVFC